MRINIGANLSKKNEETNRLALFLTEQVTYKPRHRVIASKAGFCSTANWFSGNTTNDGIIGAVTKLYQGIGNGVEEEIVKAYERNDSLLGTQVMLPTPDNVELGGYIDMIAINAHGVPSLFEIKTCTAIPSKIKDEHAAQTATYWTFSGIDNCYLIYVSRRVQDYPDPTPLIKVFPFEPSKYEKQIDRVFLSLVSFNSNLPPTRPEEFSENAQCTFCNFKSRCWNDSSTKFMSGSMMNAALKKANKLKEETLKRREDYYVKTLKNCLSSVPENKKIELENFIEKGKK